MRARGRWYKAAGVAAIVALCALAACTPPRVELKRADLAKITTTGFRVDMNLSIFNPNQYTFPLQSVQWKLDLFGSAFTNGTVRTQKQIAAGRTTEVRVPLGVRFSRVRLGLKDLASGRNIPWAITGKCDFNTPLGPVFVRFARDGTWPNPLKGRRLGGGGDPSIEVALEAQ